MSYGKGKKDKVLVTDRKLFQTCPLDLGRKKNLTVCKLAFSLKGKHDGSILFFVYIPGLRQKDSIGIS